MLFYICMSLSIILIPGPDMLFVLTQSIASGGKAGMRTILGSLTGTLFHTLLASWGLSIIIQRSPFAFNLIKIVGAIYLLYLAFQAFREQSKLIPDQTPLQNSKGFFTKGFITNISNPKMPIFFLTFLPQFVHVGHGHESLQIFMLGVIFIVETLFVFSIISFFASQLRTKLTRKTRISGLIKYLKGTIFVSLGIKILFLGR